MDRALRRCVCVAMLGLIVPVWTVGFGLDAGRAADPYAPPPPPMAAFTAGATDGLDTPSPPADVGPWSRLLSGASSAAGPLTEAPTGPITVPGANATIHMPFTLDVSARTDEGHQPWRIGSIDVAANQGELMIHGRAVPVVAYQRIPWPAVGYTLYQAIGVEPDTWHVMWFYCRAGDLVYVWHEDTGGAPLEYRYARGSCDETLEGHDVRYLFPTIEMPIPDLDSTDVLIGRDIYYDGTGPGTILSRGRQHHWVPFEPVDCSGCGGLGWYELHIVLWDPEAATASFLILYRYPGLPLVGGSYGLEFPTLERLSQGHVALWVPPA